MFTSASDNWDSIRQTFADQFEQDGTNFVYRRSQKGDAIRLSPEERQNFIDEFDRNISRAKWIIYIGLTLVISGTVGYSLLKNLELSQAAILVGIGLVMIPYLAYYRWAWAAPTRELAGRTPIAGKRSREEVLRLRFRRMTYGQLAGAALGGLAIPFIVTARQDVFLGWNRLWLVFGGALILLAAVQAFRKWRFEQNDSHRNAIAGSFNRDIAKLAQDSAPPVKNRLWRYLPLVVIFLGLAFIALTPAGKQLAQQPSFWPIVMIGFAGWSIFTVVQVFAKGHIEPFTRGFYNTYQRETQPKRFWASMAWNSAFACLCLWLAFEMNRQTKAEALQDRCYNERASPKEIFPACTELMLLRPRDSDAYLHRGLAFLNSWKLDQAVADFTKAHELDHESPWPLANRGIAYAWKNDRVRAERDFEAVKVIDPRNIVVLHGEAILSMNAGALEVAIERLTAALKLDPKDGWALQTRADAYQQSGDFPKAREDRDQLRQLTSSADGFHADEDRRSDSRSNR